MAEMQLSLSFEESKFLIELLDESLKRARVEEHRTRAPSYREHVVRREELMESLLAKLRSPAETVTV